MVHDSDSRRDPACAVAVADVHTMPSADEITEEGFGYFRDTWWIGRVPVDEAQATLTEEAEIIDWLDRVATTPDEFELLASAIENRYDGELPEALHTAAVATGFEGFLGDVNDGAPLEGLEIGVAGLTHALSAIQCLTAASCRWHISTRSWSDSPVVLFAARRWRLEILADLIAAAGCGLGQDRGMLTVYGASIRGTHRLDRRKCRPRSSPRWTPPSCSTGWGPGGRRFKSCLPHVIRGLTSSGHGVETVEALAGTGKTFTAGLLAEAYTAGGFRVLGAAPTGRAVRELAEQSRIGEASTLTRLALDLAGDQGGFGAGPAVLILDEAGMASTRETAGVLAHAHAARVKVIAIGDSGQLSSVQAGGWLGSLTRRLGSHELRHAPARSARAPAPVSRAPGFPHRLHRREDRPGAVAHRRRRRAKRKRRRARRGRGLARAPGGVRVGAGRPDRPRQQSPRAPQRARPGRAGARWSAGKSVHVGGHEFAIGDRVIARRNDRLRAVDNGTRGTVIAVDQVEKDLVVRADAGAQRTLDAAYVAKHLQHAYALTAHSIQGGGCRRAPRRLHPQLVVHRSLTSTRGDRAVPHRRPDRARTRPHRDRSQSARGARRPARAHRTPRGRDAPSRRRGPRP